MIETRQVRQRDVDPRDGDAETGGLEAFVLHVVSASHGVSVPALFAPTRSKAAVALARQVAMYLGHVSCGLTLTEAGVGIGRDRTTAAHACHRIEDRRDDATFDTALDYLDAAVRGRIGHGKADVPPSVHEAGDVQC